MQRRIDLWRWLSPALPPIALLIGIVIWGLYFTYQYDPEEGLNVIEAVTTLDLAQVALRVVEGKGLVTGFIRPVSLRFHPAILNHPELTHPPLYILILALAIKLFGARDITLVAVSIFFFWACIPWLWFFSRRFFGNVVAGLVIILYCINPILLRHSINGGPVTFLGFLTLLFFYCLYRSVAGGTASFFWPLLSGVVVGIAYLTRYSYGLWIFPGALFLFLDPRKGRLRRIVFFAAAAVAVAIPWIVRNWVVAGGPFFSLQGFKPVMFTDPRPGYTLWRSFSARSLIVPRRFFFALKKFLLGFRDQYLDILILTGNFVSVFSLTAILHRFRERVFDQLKYVMFIMIGLEVVHLSLYRPAGNGLAALIPWALLVGGAFFAHLVSRIRRRKFLYRGSAVVFFFLLTIIPTSDKLGPRLVPRFRLYNVENIISVSGFLPPDSILVSDVPWAVAWYGKIPCLWLPYRMEDYEEIRIYHHPPVAGFYLTPFYFGLYYLPQERSPDWEKVYQTGWIPGGWEMTHKTVLPENQILISREPYLRP